MGASISLDFITHKFSASAEPTLKDIEAECKMEHDVSKSLSLSLDER